MNISKILLATLAGGLALFAGGSVIYVLLGGGALISSGPAAEAATLSSYRLEYIVVFELLNALLVSIVFGRWANIRTFTTGALHGAWMFALIGLIVQCDYMANTDITSLTGVLFFGATTAVRGALAGGVIGWVLGRGKPE